MRYYFDTSIWIDIFEGRDRLSKKLLDKIIYEDNRIVYSQAIIAELIGFGYHFFDIKDLFRPFRYILTYVLIAKHNLGKAKDLASKRGIPKRDALHALLAREYRAILVTRDRDFERLRDIIISKRPEELI